MREFDYGEEDSIPDNLVYDPDTGLYMEKGDRYLTQLRRKRLLLK